VIETLKALLSTLSPNIDITLGDDVTIEDVSDDCEVTVKHGAEPQEKAVVGHDEVVLYPETFDSDEHDEYRTFVERYKRREGRIATTGAEREAEAIESVENDEVTSVVDFFDGLVSNRHHEVLKKAQYLRTLSEKSNADIDPYRAKGDLADRYGYEAYYIANLVSSGYFDEGRCLRAVYRRLGETATDADEAFRSEFETMIREELVATFVNSDDSPHEVKTEIKSGVFGQLRHDPRIEFFDVCGLGATCERTIDTAVADLREDYPELETERKDRGEERVERLYPDTIENFGIR
jgi:hypothetical protein